MNDMENMPQEELEQEMPVTEETAEAAETVAEEKTDKKHRFWDRNRRDERDFRRRWGDARRACIAPFRA